MVSLPYSTKFSLVEFFTIILENDVPRPPERINRDWSWLRLTGVSFSICVAVSTHIKDETIPNTSTNLYVLASYDLPMIGNVKSKKRIKTLELRALNVNIMCGGRGNLNLYGIRYDSKLNS